jgi:hypothetical protein
MLHEPYALLAGSGYVVLGISYGVPVFIGAIVLLTNSLYSGPAGCDSECKNEAEEAMLPVAGPLLLLHADIKVGLVWSGLQAAGLTMLIVGLIGHEVPQAPLPMESPAAGKVSVVPLVTSQGGTLSLRMDW